MDLQWIANYILIFVICECVHGQRRGPPGPPGRPGPPNRPRPPGRPRRPPPRHCELPNGENGICVPIDNCWQSNRRRHREPPVCYFRGRYPFVCCTPFRPQHRPEINISGRTSEEKCNGYKNITTDGPGSFVPAVVGGVDSLAKEFPHMAALGYGSEEDIQWNCGGTLISDQFVLTAAHCLYSQGLGEVQYVRLGDLNLAISTDDAQPQDFKIIQRIPHPEYSPPSHYNDIALVQLERPVQYTSYVKPACLQIEKDLNNTLAIATGWGTIEFGGQTRDHLQKVYLRYFTNEQCQLTYPIDNTLQNSVVDDHQLCAGGIDEEKDTCQGDSGGPLQYKTTIGVPTNYIIGITSFGKGCGVANTPGVYTRVSYYVPWIEKIVWSN